jgi:hypothetical protein
MDDVQALVEEARRIYEHVIRLARLGLTRGDDISRVQRAVMAASECLEDIELYALLTTAPSTEAEAMIRERTRDLRTLRDSLRSG